jgi:indole-3-glycerol phosphate synthase
LNVERFLVFNSRFSVLGSWFLVPGSWFSVLGSQFSVLGSWFLVLGSRFSVLSSQFLVPGSQFSVLSSWFSVLSSQFSVLGSQFSVLSSQFLVPGSQFSVLSSWFLVLGSQFSVLSSWFSVLGSWFSVLGSWFSVLGSPMDTILNRILTHKRVEVERQRIKIPDAQIRARAATAPPPRDFAAALRAHRPIALIAEVKKASPSKGVLLENFDPLALAHTYASNGASAISVLTDVRFFQGSLKYLEGIRAMVDRGAAPPLPLLRKDFIIDPYQVAEARAYGADALLLIVAALDDETLAALLALTHSFGMQALVEVHNEDELRRALEAGASIIGVNNRDLHSFTTTLETTQRLAALLPSSNRPLLVSESGIFTAEHVALVRSWGADAVLVGEALVTAPDIASKVRELGGGS